MEAFRATAETLMDEKRAALDFARKPHRAGQGLRTRAGKWEQAANRQQRALVNAYDGWGRSLRGRLKTAALGGANAAQLTAITEASLADLSATVSTRALDGIRQAAGLGISRGRLNTPAVQALIASRQLDAQRLIAQNLMPFIRTSLAANISPAVALDRVRLLRAFLPVRSRVASYAGGAWTMIFETQRQVGLNEDAQAAAEGRDPSPVRWVLDKRAQHCAASTGHFGCPDLAGEYDGGWGTLATVPAGQVTCRGNCKCVLEVFRDGRWQRGLA